MPICKGRMSNTAVTELQQFWHSVGLILSSVSKERENSLIMLWFCNLEGSGSLGQGLANFFYKEPNNKMFKVLWAKYSLCHICLFSFFFFLQPFKNVKTILSSGSVICNLHPRPLFTTLCSPTLCPSFSISLLDHAEESIMNLPVWLLSLLSAGRKLGF